MTDRHYHQRSISTTHVKFDEAPGRVAHHNHETDHGEVRQSHGYAQRARNDAQDTVRHGPPGIGAEPRRRRSTSTAVPPAQRAPQARAKHFDQAMTQLLRTAAEIREARERLRAAEDRDANQSESLRLLDLARQAGSGL